jgi:hypothetical protein
METWRKQESSRQRERPREKPTLGTPQPVELGDNASHSAHGILF